MTVNTRYRILFILIVVSFIYIIFIIYTSPYDTLSRLGFICNSSTYTSEDTVCPGVFSHMTRGYWKPLPHFTRELVEILVKRFRIENARIRHMPESYQRKDGKCGNVNFMRANFRALCNPKGPTPCCYDGYCVSKSIEDCKCEECYDLRQRISAESSTWVPSHPGCQVDDFDSTTACRLLHNSTIFWSGNSFVRQMFMALTMILRGDLTHAVVYNIKEPKKRCHDLGNMHGYCQKNILTNPIVCNGSVNITFIYRPQASQIQEIHRAIDDLRDKPRTMIVLGLGILDNYNYTKILNNHIHPILEHYNAKKSVWPKFVWAAAHAPGLLKNPFLPLQLYKPSLHFNEWLNPRLEKLGIPVFDTFNMTDGVSSHDGCHHGIAVNMLKARIFLHYIAELQRKGQW
ncbi:uncharacterized protein LOC126809976 [Patella vulgata]|uniref:uncharacterized protein LOC126809976 n=1 Tax=Patella vulgata TaxID=6465 RepID=UPI0024A9A921|nr:uncharacterized protein LOC126809976 [Patella vulgata]